MKMLKLFAIGIAAVFVMPLNLIAQPQISVESTTLPQGGTGSMNLKITGGTTSYSGINAKILLPSEISVIDVSKGPLLTEKFKTAWHSFPAADGKNVILIAYSGLQSFAETEGILLSMNLQAAGYAAPGAYGIAFASANPVPNVNSRYALSNADGSLSIEPSVLSGSINITLGEDLDNDYIPDWWENILIDANSGDTIETINDVSPSGDFDNDGYSNLIEFKHNLDPTVADTFLRGDVNADYEITPQDARDAFHLSLQDFWTEAELNCADYNQDGQITPQDAKDIFNATF